MQFPTPDEIETYLTVFVASAVCVGACGTAIEALGDKLKMPAVVSFGRALEDFAANIPRLLGREKPRT